jgi:hypothetical protein
MDRIVDELPPYYSLNGKWKIGNFAYRGDEITLFDKNLCFDYGGEFNTPSSHFRRYIKHVQFSKKNPPDTLSYPYYALPIKLPEAVYLDISQAFRQIGNVLGSETHWKETQHFSFGEHTYNSPLFDVKLMRGMLVSATNEKGSITSWNSDTHELVSKRFENSHYAPHFRTGILRILHAVAASLLPYIVYWHTDGMILPTYNLSKVENILSHWGLDTKVKDFGLTTVKQRGVYSIGNHQTSQFFRFKMKSSLYVNSQNYRWFMSQFQKGKSLRNDLNYGIELL